MILKEGGNIFKDEQGTPVTQRISRNDVDPTLTWLEKITGLNHTDNKLGSTGIKDTSGDLDVAIDSGSVDKTDLYNKLVAWKTKNHPDDDTRAWVAKSGISVHFKTPINGNPNNGFVQTDLMFGNPEAMKFAFKGTGDGTVYKGAHRAIMIASMAKARGMKWSPGKGLVDRETNDLVASAPDEVATALMGQGSTRADMDSVETIIKKIKNSPDYEALTADAFANFEKQGLPLPESRGMITGMIQAKQRVDEKNIIGKTFDKVKALGKTAVAGAKAGYDISSQGTGKPLDTYKKAGGGQTTVGQTANLAKTIGNKIGGNNVILKKPGFKDLKIAVNQEAKIAKLKSQGWAVFDPDRIIQMVSKDGKQILDVRVGDRDDYLKKGWTPYKPNKQKESVNEAARIDHAEDLVYLQGSQGAMRALASLRDMAQGGKGNVTLKWDGSPAIIFGRNENGEFVLTDKGGFVAKGYDGKATSGEDLQSMLMARPGAKNPDKVKRDRYIQFAKNMGQVYSVFEKAVPESYRGYFKGDLLYYTTPQVIEKNFVFKPNIVEYAVDVASDLGKKIAKSTAGVVVHRVVDPDGSESPLKDLDVFQGNSLLVVPPVTIEEPAQVPNEEISRLEQIIKKDAKDIDSLLDENKLRQMKMTDFPKIIYKYMNSKVDTGLDNLGRDFTKWLDSRKDISIGKKTKMIEYIKQNMNAWTSLFEVITGVMKAKDSIIADLDSRPGTVSSKTDGKEGGEGYVLAHPEGDIKLVNRAGFTAANRAVER
tara:strand:- start:916 stop:3207 length:2292 start_codon:yes stop_codon:yes gene_type:complete